MNFIVELLRVAGAIQVLKISNSNQCARLECVMRITRAVAKWLLMCGSLVGR